MTMLRFVRTLPLPSRIVEVFSTTGWATAQVAHRSKHRFTFRFIVVSATEPSVFIAARVIGGLGIGISTVVAPLYISEIAPPKYRGRLAGMFQFNIVFGILMAFLSNALLAGLGENAWRWMLGVAAFPSLLYALFCFVIPESPRWLLSRKGDREAGMQVLQRIQPDASESVIAAEADKIMVLSTARVSGR